MTHPHVHSVASPDIFSYEGQPKKDCYLVDHKSEDKHKGHPIMCHRRYREGI